MTTGLIRHSAKILWLITKDDFPTFVLPNTVFGVCNAIASSRTSGLHPLHILSRLPQVLFFNWTNLLVFDLANQRSPASAAEDGVNKPWRPVPAGLLTSDDLRQTMLFAIPAVLCLNALLLDTASETLALFTLTWLYNDLGGGDASWVTRNAIIAAAFGFYNLGSLRVALADDGPVSDADAVWICVVSGVILTTMHVQDLKDVAGDRLRGRDTLPVRAGVEAARLSLLPPVVLWTVVCACYWGMGWCSVAGGGVAACLLFRCSRRGDRYSERRTWHLWCLWTAVLYTMPLAF